MEINKIKSYIGFAIKSGNVVFGYDNLLANKKCVQVVIICSLLNEKMTNKVANYCNENNVRFLKLKDISLYDLVSRNCKVIGISDVNLASAILKELKMEN